MNWFERNQRAIVAVAAAVIVFLQTITAIISGNNATKIDNVHNQTKELRKHQEENTDKIDKVHHEVKQQSRKMGITPKE